MTRAIAPGTVPGSDRVEALLAAMAGRRVAVIGDLMLDRYLHGDVGRISPEAPVPVVELRRETFFPGGAANAAANVAALGGDAVLAGAIGEDAVGDCLRGVLEERGIRHDGVIALPRRPTTEKIRVVSQRQQLLRMDREDQAALADADTESVLAAVRSTVDSADAVVVEDYGKGLVTAALVEAIAAAAGRRAIPVVFDPREGRRPPLDGVTVVTPNRREAFWAAGIEWSAPVDPIENESALAQVGDALLATWGAAAVLVTLGEQGMCLFLGKADDAVHLPTAAREVFDVSGAGDTVAAVIALALAAGADLPEACGVANLAAGVVVAKSGTATADPVEVVRAAGAP